MTFESADILRDAVDGLCSSGAIDEALDLCKEANIHAKDLRVRAASLLLRGDLLLRLGHDAEATRQFIECRNLAQQIGGEVQNLLADASYYVALVSDPSSVENIELAIGLFEQMIAEGQREAAGLGKLARLYQETGRLEQAKSLYEEARQKSVGEEAVYAACALALVTGRLEGYAAGRNLLEEACRLAAEYPRAEPSAFWELGMFEWESEHYSDALLFLRASVEVIDKDPVLARNGRFVAEVHWRIGRIFYAQGALDEAIEHCFQVLHATAEPSRYTGGAHLILGCCFAARNDGARATYHYRECLRSPEIPEDDRLLAIEGLQRFGTDGQA